MKEKAKKEVSGENLFAAMRKFIRGGSGYAGFPEERKTDGDKNAPPMDSKK